VNGPSPPDELPPESTHIPGEVGPGGIEIAVDREKCMGSGNCAYWAPQVFDLDDDGLAIVVGDPSGGEDRVQLAARNCPTEAITVRTR